MKTLICIENLSYSAFNYECIKNVNSYVEENTDEISFCSMDQTFPFMDINSAIYHPNEIDCFNNGVIITSKIDIAKHIVKATNSSQKILYLYDIEWMFNLSSYDDIYEVLSNKTLKIFARSEDHVRPIKNLSNREPDAIINNFNLEKIWNLL